MAKAGAVGHGQWRGRDMTYVCITMLLPSHYVRRDAIQPQRTTMYRRAPLAGVSCCSRTSTTRRSHGYTVHGLVVSPARGWGQTQDEQFEIRPAADALAGTAAEPITRPARPGGGGAPCAVRKSASGAPAQRSWCGVSCNVCREGERASPASGL